MPVFIFVTFVGNVYKTVLDNYRAEARFEPSRETKAIVDAKHQ